MTTSNRPEPDRAFEVVLARSGTRMLIPAGQSILDTLLDAGISVPYSCHEGICGTCETRVLDGVPEHRDSVLFGEDAKCTDRMMVCVSRCAGDHLTLDL